MQWSKSRLILSSVIFILMIVVFWYMSWKRTPIVIHEEQTIKNVFFEKRVDGALRITNCYPRSCQNPVFSPDSSQIIFTRFLNGYNKGPSELVKINLETGEEKIIIKADGDSVNVPYGSWIGNKIIFASDLIDSDEIVIANDDGTAVTKVTNTKDRSLKIEPVFNPKDTTNVVFEEVPSDGKGHKIKLVDVFSKKEFYLTNDSKYDDRLPSWSADGKKILWQRTEIGKDNWKIYTADIIFPIASQSLVTIPYFEHIKTISSGPDDTDNSWTWDGNILSSRSGDGNIPNIFLFVNGKWQRITKSDKEDGAPSQSPDKKWTGFESHISDENSQSNIWVINNSTVAKAKDFIGINTSSTNSTLLPL